MTYMSILFCFLTDSSSNIDLLIDHFKRHHHHVIFFSLVLDYENTEEICSVCNGRLKIPAAVGACR